VDRLEQLIVDVKESLEREFGGLRLEVRQGFADLNTRLDTQSAELDRQAELWQATLPALLRPQ
jgi:hypothetical protein